HTLTLPQYFCERITFLLGVRTNYLLHKKTKIMAARAMKIAIFKSLFSAALQENVLFSSIHVTLTPNHLIMVVNDSNVVFPPLAPCTHPHTHTHVYIYVCVCVCVYIAVL
ncbi:hypothetical protein L9F63_002805, partial [Diploptera punctata]